MDPLYAALLVAITACISSLASYLTARAQYTAKLAKAVEPAVEAERERIAGRRAELAKSLAAELTDWADKTPERVTRERCDSKHAALERQLTQLTSKVDEIVGSVGDLGREVSGLAGEVRRINGRSSRE